MAIEFFIVHVGKFDKANFKIGLTDHDIQGEKFIKLLEKMIQNFASLFFVWIINQFLTNLLKYKRNRKN